MSRQPYRASELVEPTPGEVEDLVAIAKWSHVDVDRYVETGELGHTPEHASGTWGRLREARSSKATRQFVAVYRPSKRERETTARWHDYCAEHGYGGSPGESGYPPHPHHGGGVWAGLTWAQLRARLRRPAEEAAARELQPTLFDA